jgi:hypothetical protein
MPDLNTPNSKGKTIKDYLPMAAKMLLGKENPKEGPVASAVENEQYESGRPAIDKERLEEVITILKDYKAGKANLEARIVEEERWWKLRHWDVIRGKNGRETAKNPEEARPEPTSAWMFNSISNKHADIMDNYPEPNVLPREMGDEQDAQTLSSILPVVFERNEYEQTYDKAAWYKLKHGVVAKGVFWNKELENGLGDIDIRFMDILNIFWEPGITDLQKSRNLFVIELKDNDLLEQEYPQLKNKLGGQIIEAKQYVHDDNVDVSKKSVVVAWYYKKRTPEGRTILHYCKFCGSEVLFASENEPENYPNGFYDHGKYPVEFDVLFPEEGTPVGFGYIAIMKSPQLYIDKLSQVILENSMMSAKVRYLVKKGSGINEEEFLDWSRPVVYYEGDPSNIIPLEVQQVGGSVINMLQMKIDELKETSSNRDVSQGSTSGGVTAAAAIAALQEAGNKTSRDMIASAYRSYAQECYLAIELIRQFYDEKRTFRIVGEKGGFEYVQYSNANIKGVPIAPYLGQEMEPGYEQAYRVPVFDVVVKPQKRSPYSKMAQNELAKELYQMGFFNPQLAEQVLTALEMMDFDGEEKVKEKVQQGQTLLNQMMMMQDQMNKMGLIIMELTGRDVLGLAEGTQKAPAGTQITPQGKSMGSAAVDAQKETMTSYGQRLAANAKPSLEQA